MVKKDFQRVLVIGDIHGNFTKLMSLHKKIKATDDDLVIYLGDYTDRGDENVKVLKFLIEESHKENVILCTGNHEILMARFIYYEDYSWLRSGGLKTLEEIQKWYAEDETASEKLSKFIKGLKSYHQMTINENKYFISHAGIDPRKPLKKQTLTNITDIREKFFVPYDDQMIMVIGHNPLMYVKSEEEIEEQCKKLGLEISSKNKRLYDALSDGEVTIYRDTEEALNIEDVKPQWRRNGKILMMDTGSFMPNGFISAVDLLSRTIYQSDKI